MIKAWFLGGLGVIGGGALGMIISIYGPEVPFGFTPSDPVVFQLTEREWAMAKKTIVGAVAGMNICGAIAEKITKRDRILQLMKDQPELFTA